MLYEDSELGEVLNEFSKSEDEGGMAKMFDASILG